MPTQLHIYDFDGTLFKSPQRPDWWPLEGWWGKAESLSPPCVPERPGSDWWVPGVVGAAKRSIASPDVYAALLTGRLVKRFLPRVRDLLRQAGLRFDGVYLAAGGTTLPGKLKTIGDLLDKMPDITRGEIWEDRPEHIGKFESVFKNRALEVKAHLVPRASHELACSEGDVKLAVRVAERFTVGRTSVSSP